MKVRPYLGWFVTPAGFVAFGFSAALVAVLQFSFRAYIPGMLEPGGFTLSNFSEIVHPAYGRAFARTLALCFYTALFSLILAYPLALALLRTRSRFMRSTILVIAVTPLFLGEIVRTYSWIIVLGNQGFVNSVLLGLGIVDKPVHLMFTTTGVVVALVHFTMPIVFVMLTAALAHIDRNLDKAAQSLGAGPIRTFLTVTLPLSVPGIVAGTTTAFAWTFSAFATPQLIGGGQVTTISTLVYQVGFASFNFPFAASLSLAGLVFTFLVLALIGFIAQRIIPAGETHAR
ncbi:ABC transporter permease [Roseibium marinum]|uniref:Putative spermidine/putrescine transport system permease protein n=1 Tax=Roseibium marinum TaxID=281252 RepID=A0A2S3UT82_9HYPH|nr:ABC transporter permease [Roseibium marinum]POF30937.1 putative spermidine/putrescine transport system permease protein [Roseibium marinum]